MFNFLIIFFFKISDFETGNYSLIIPESIVADGAAYRIVFVSDVGEVSSGALAYVKPLKETPKILPANFLTPLQNVTVAEGDTLTLKCQVSGEPQPKVKKEKQILI